MTDSSQEGSPSRDTRADQATEETPYEEGKRAGTHPFVVVIVVILGLWFLLWLYIPSSQNKRATTSKPPPTSLIQSVEDTPVMFRVQAALPELNLVTIVVPPQATDSQVMGLLLRFRTARLDNTLSTLLPATTPEHQLGNHAVAEIFVFSDRKYAAKEAVAVLARGAHAPGHLYPQAIPFEEAMEKVRGHYRIDLNDRGRPDRASLGFADESGVHSKHYQSLF